MKKTLSLISVLISLFGSQAYAKTEGNYVGINLLRSNLKTNSSSFSEVDKNSFYNRKNKISRNGIGLNYKYAFNFNNFFIAPEISYESLNNETTSASFYNKNNENFGSFLQNLRIKNAISLKSNFGYDFNEQFALFIPLGVSRFGYEVESNDISINSLKTSSKSANKSVIISGLGLSYQKNKNWIFNLEYNKYQNFKIKSVANYNSGETIVKTNLDTIKLGISYRF